MLSSCPVKAAKAQFTCQTRVSLAMSQTMGVLTGDTIICPTKVLKNERTWRGSLCSATILRSSWMKTLSKSLMQAANRGLIRRCDTKTTREEHSTNTSQPSTKKMTSITRRGSWSTPTECDLLTRYFATAVKRANWRKLNTSARPRPGALVYCSFSRVCWLCVSGCPFVSESGIMSDTIAATARPSSGRAMSSDNRLTLVG